MPLVVGQEEQTHNMEIAEHLEDQEAVVPVRGSIILEAQEFRVKGTMAPVAHMNPLVAVVAGQLQPVDTQLLELLDILPEEQVLHY
jgi:predicted ATPase with chaperone activity